MRWIKIIRAVWLLICFTIGLTYLNQEYLTGEAIVTFIKMMTIVTFPIGYLAIYIMRAMVWVMAATFDHQVASSYNLMMTLWVLMTVLGYFQWFYVVPRLLTKLGIIKTS
jgi:hypothetical protein